MIRILLIAGSVALFAACHAANGCLAQEASASATAAPNAGTPPSDVAASASGVRRALILCGLPGDAEHRKLFGETLTLFFTGLTEQHGFLPENVTILWGDEPTEKDSLAIRASRGVTSRETIEQAAQSIRDALQPDDTLWVIVMGHAHFDGRYSWLNIAGPDMHQLEFGHLFEKLACREQVFFVTTPSSGFSLKPLASPGRVVITATEADLEVNETTFPHKLAAALTSPPEDGTFDGDKDGQITLLDLYLFTAREVAQEYATGELLATEHSLIDDNGDGRGTEVQREYLPEELGGRLRAGDALPTTPKSDVRLARAIRLPWPIKTIAPEAAP